MLSFAVWAWGGSSFSSEAAMYAACALVFLGLGGLALLPAARPLGAPASIAFCLRFAAGFLLYALLWSVAWFTFRNTFGEIFGSFLGLLCATALWRPRHRAQRGLLTATALVFLWHSLGYYAGGFAYQSLQNRGVFPLDLPMRGEAVTTLARFAWGLLYGLGLGRGIVAILSLRPEPEEESVETDA